MPEKKPKYKAFRYFSLLTELGLSLICPILLCAWGAGYLRDRFGLGNWVMLVAILFGTLSGITSAAKLLLPILRESQDTQQQR